MSDRDEIGRRLRRIMHLSLELDSEGHREDAAILRELVAENEELRKQVQQFRQMMAAAISVGVVSSGHGDVCSPGHVQFVAPSVAPGPSKPDPKWPQS